MTSLDKFGMFIIKQLRDRSIEQYEILEAGGWATPKLKTLQLALRDLSDENKLIIRRCVFDVIDTALHDVLAGLQEAHDLDNGIEVFVDGENIAEASGMLHSELFGDDGWIKRFSQYSEMP